MVNIRPLKERISARFPGRTITEILKNEPDEIGAEELIAKVGTWLSVADTDKMEAKGK